MKQYYISAPEVIRILELPEGKTYEVFRESNQELKVQGYITVSERVPRASFNKKFFGDLEEVVG